MVNIVLDSDISYEIERDQLIDIDLSKDQWNKIVKNVNKNNGNGFTFKVGEEDSEITINIQVLKDR